MNFISINVFCDEFLPVGVSLTEGLFPVPIPNDAFLMPLNMKSYTFSHNIHIFSGCLMTMDLLTWPQWLHIITFVLNIAITIIIVVITINIIAVMIRLQQSQHCTAAPHWQVDCVQRCNRKKEDVKRIATDVKRSTQIFSRPQVYWLKWLGFEKVPFLCYCDF